MARATSSPRVSLAKANATTAPKQYGPQLGNAQEPNSYLKIKQNIDGLTSALNSMTPAEQQEAVSVLAGIGISVTAAGQTFTVSLQTSGVQAGTYVTGAKL